MAAHPTLWRKLRRDIRRTLPLFSALVVTVMLGIALYAAADNSYRNLVNSYDNAFEQEGFPDLFVTGGDVAGYAAEAAAQGEVQATRTRVQTDLPMSVPADAGATARLVGRIVGYPTSGTPEVASVTVLSGATNPAPGSVLVEKHMAGDFDLVEGDRITITTAVGEVAVRVAGVVGSAEYLWPAASRQAMFPPPKTFGALFVAEEDARTWSGGPDNQALVLLTDAARGDEQALDDVRVAAVAAGATEVLDRSQQPSNSLLQEDISGFEQMAVAFPALFLSAAALALYVLLTRRVTEERQIIGTLRAQGMRSRTIGWHYLSYGLAAGVIGAALGLPLGMAMAGAMSRLYVEVIGLPEQLQVFGGYGLSTVLIGLGFALVATSIAGLFPARRAARILPAEAMRGEVPAARAGRSWAERLLPRTASARSRMIVRGIGRSRKRTVFTAAGVAMALILVLVSGGMLDTMNNLIRVQFQQVSTANLQIDYAAPVGDEQLTEVAGVPGIAEAESVATQEVSVAYEGAVYATALTAYDSDTVMHGFIDAGGDPLQLPDDGVLVDEAITAQIPDLAPGAEVTLTFPALGTSVTTTVADFSYQPLGTFVHASKTWASEQIPTAQPTTVLATTAEDADSDDLRRQLLALPGVIAVVETSALEDLYHQFAGLFLVFIGAMLVLGAAMAFAIIFTTMSVNIVERQRELATLRAAGVRHRLLAGLVGGENLIVATFGIIPGLILGWIAADVMLQTYSSDQFTLDLQFRASTILLSVGVIMLVAALSQIPGLRAIRRMDIARVVRERAA